jgi:hypothetical protein
MALQSHSPEAVRMIRSGNVIGSPCDIQSTLDFCMTKNDVIADRTVSLAHEKVAGGGFAPSTRLSVSTGESSCDVLLLVHSSARLRQAGVSRMPLTLGGFF